MDNETDICTGEDGGHDYAGDVPGIPILHSGFHHLDYVLVPARPGQRCVGNVTRTAGTPFTHSYYFISILIKSRSFKPDEPRVIVEERDGEALPLLVAPAGAEFAVIKTLMDAWDIFRVPGVRLRGRHKGPDPRSAGATFERYIAAYEVLKPQFEGRKRGLNQELAQHLWVKPRTISRWQRKYGWPK